MLERTLRFIFIRGAALQQNPWSCYWPFPVPRWSLGGCKDDWSRKLQHSLTSLHRKYKGELKRWLQDYMQERKNRELKRVKKRWIYRIQACCRGGRRPCTCSQPCQRLSRGETIRIHESNAIFKSYDSALCRLIGGDWRVRRWYECGWDFGDWQGTGDSDWVAHGPEF